MVTMHETTRLGDLLDSLTADTVDLNTSARQWSDETGAMLLESIITGTPIGMITLAAGPQGRWIADGRRRLQVLLTASAATPDREPSRFDVDLAISRRTPANHVGVNGRNRQRKMVPGRSTALDETVPRSTEDDHAWNEPGGRRTASRPRP